MIQNYRFEMPVANVPKAVSLQGNFIEVIEAVGTLSIVFSPGFTITAKKGDVIRSDNFPVCYEGFQVSSDTVSDVIVLKAGRGITFSLSWLREKLDTLIAAVVAIPAAVVNTMMVWTAGAVSVPLQSTNGQDLAVGGLNVYPGLLGAGAVINVQGSSFMRVVVQAAGAIGDYATFTDSGDLTNEPLTILDENGNVSRIDGRIYFNTVAGVTYSPSGSVYYINTRGIREVTITAGIGAPSYSVVLSPLEMVPNKSKPRQVLFNATDLGVAPGAYGAGAADIITTASIKAALDALGIIPQKLTLMISWTPGGTGADGFFLEYQKILNGVSSQRLFVNSTVFNTAAAALHKAIIGAGYGGTVTNALGIASAAMAVASTNQMALPIGDIIFYFRKSTATNVGVINDINLLVEE